MSYPDPHHEYDWHPPQSSADHWRIVSRWVQMQRWYCGQRIILRARWKTLRARWRQWQHR